VGDFVPIPDYYDAQLKIGHDLGQNESVEVLALTSRDALTRTLKNEDPAQDKSDYTLTSFSRVGLSYKKQLEDGASVLIAPWVGVDHMQTRSPSVAPRPSSTPRAKCSAFARAGAAASASTW